MAEVNKGYIYLFRSVWDSDVFEATERFDRRSAWIWLLTHANYKEKSVMIRGHIYKIQRGQLMTSVRKLSEIWHWNPRTVMNYLKLLELEEMITRTRTPCATLITVCNYSKYQDPTLYRSDEYNTERNSERNTGYNTECTQLSNDKRNDKRKEKKIEAGGQVIE